MYVWTIVIAYPCNYHLLGVFDKIVVGATTTMIPHFLIPALISLFSIHSDTRSVMPSSTVRLGHNATRSSANKRPGICVLCSNPAIVTPNSRPPSNRVFAENLVGFGFL